MFTVMPEGGARSGSGDAAGGRLAEVRRALAGTRFADVRWVAETGSTNADVLALAREGAPEGTVVVADHQRAGRGRRARRWVAPPGGSLLVSVLLRPRADVASLAPMAAAVALAEAAQGVGGVEARLKWPNDLVVATPSGERKLAGLLAEADWPVAGAVPAGGRRPAAEERVVVVVGAGLNVAWPGRGGDAGLPADLAEVAGTATALSWLGAEVDRADVLVAYLRALEPRYGRLSGGVEAGTEVVDAWRARSATLGRRVRVDLGGAEVEGIAVDLTPQGHLVVDTGAHGRRTLAVGDVVHLRPAVG